VGGGLLAIDHAVAAARSRSTSRTSATFEASARARTSTRRRTPCRARRRRGRRRARRRATIPPNARRPASCSACRRRSSPARSRCPPGRRAARRTLPSPSRKAVSKRVSYAPRCDRLAQRPRHLELLGKEHHARVRRPPQDRVALGEPREDAVAVRARRRSGDRSPPAHSKPLGDASAFGPGGTIGVATESCPSINPANRYRALGRSQDAGPRAPAVGLGVGLRDPSSTLYARA
jgi:hypothetical protein